MVEVFTQHKLDFGHTDKVNHPVTLSDKTLFKQHHWPIHLQDVDAVCKNLQELAEPGVIRESESSFSSCIVVNRKN